MYSALVEWREKYKQVSSTWSRVFVQVFYTLRLFQKMEREY